MNLATLSLFRFGAPGKERPGVLLSEGEHTRALAVSDLCDDYNEAFFEAMGVEGLRRELEQRAGDCPELNFSDLRLGPPIARPSKILGIGLNYRAHAQETGAPVPSDPKLFMKASTALSGINDALTLPPGSIHTDYEVELALIIGRRASRVTLEQAPGFIAGYSIMNDYSEREWQKNRDGQFVKGKSADGFAPLGPVLVPADLLDPGDLRLWLEVNGKMRQDSRTSDMVFNCAELVSKISHYMTLLPGDVITTGTPSGVGLGMKPPTFLKPGDVVRYGIESIGEGEQIIR
jgi:2-keto-4-pentenoate hydratase/2-oxohepta-3-ene-1,7-dioic acid hydratase in catechol pathway